MLLVIMTRSLNNDCMTNRHDDGYEDITKGYNERE